MFELTFNVSRFVIKPAAKYEVPTENRNYVIARFIFSDEWIGIPAIAIFMHREKGIPYHVPINENRCIVPWEVLQEPGTVYVGCVAGDRAVSLSTTFNVIGGIYYQSSPSEPPPPSYEYVTSPADNRILLIRGTTSYFQYYYDGDWHTISDGGYVPQRGVDYWTDEDKTEIQAYIDAKIDEALNNRTEN